MFKEAEIKFGSVIYEFFYMSKKEFESLLIQLPSITRYIPQRGEVRKHE
ncbi:hypothetical protein DF16_orf03828 [Bacillus thuringiensis serovar kurstaki str. YBT-1520]|nr:hypothetical protein DF16_orf03828 [Bacillus thuringiensis serovar kurstaki str. YBT-1520]